MKVYKLLIAMPDGRLLSAYTPPSKRLEYKLGEKTVPKIPGSLLMAYEDLAYISGVHNNLALFEAEAEVVIDFLGERSPLQIPRMSIDEMSADDEDITDFWKSLEWMTERRAEEGIYAGYTFPDGTVFCESITLTRRIR